MVSITAQPYRVSLWGVIVGVLVLALASATLVLGGLVQAQEDGAIEHPENDKGTVAVFTATDPEDDEVTWTTTGADEALFAISEDGVLTFVSPPTTKHPETTSTR